MHVQHHGPHSLLHSETIYKGHNDMHDATAGARAATPAVQPSGLWAWAHWGLGLLLYQWLVASEGANSIRVLYP